SAQKKKRLEKYLATKLRKDETAALLRKLEHNAAKVDTTLFQSARTLGRGRETKRERLGRALRERAAGLGDGGETVLFEARGSAQGAESDDQEESGNDIEEGKKDLNDKNIQDNEGSLEFRAEEKEAGDLENRAINDTGTFGSGLKRPLEVDETGRPILKRRKRRKKNEKSKLGQEAAIDGEHEEWNGFDSQPENAEPSLNESEKYSNGYEQSSRASEKSDSSSSEDNDEDLSQSEGESENSSPGSSTTSSTDDKKERISAFKHWATTHRNAALNFTPSVAPPTEKCAAARANFTPRAPSPDPLLASISLTTSFPPTTHRPTALVIPRPEDIQNSRLSLPVVRDEQKIMEAITAHPLVILCGATGSGKTTQIPQMLFEAGYTYGGKMMIGVTQPRRVAAVSVAARVATELGPEHGKVVAHQVRYDTRVSGDTGVKFMTDGILLREIGGDFVLSKYAAIVLDEVHERSVNTDLLIGLLTRIVALRGELAKEDPEKHVPLKVVIMSATLRGCDFMSNARLFRSGPPPVVEAEGRQWDVTVHFARRTRSDWVEECVGKVVRGHQKLPAGGMLVFLTGRDEILNVMKRLKERFGDDSASRVGGRDDFEDADDEVGTGAGFLEEEEGEITGEGPDEVEFDVPDDQPAFRAGSGTSSWEGVKPYILPLYAALAPDQQLRVFHPPPPNTRLIVLATNVAETSLTIPNIRYVIDCGRAKEKRYNTTTGVQTYEIDWISQASAAQRMGRAGRTGPGHCWRLYSSAIFEHHFPAHVEPEMLRTPLESVVLQLKALGVEKVRNFPFPTPPREGAIEAAERLLTDLGMLDATPAGKITEMGREIMAYPVHPRFGKMMWLGRRNAVGALVGAVVAGLACGGGELYVSEAEAAALDASGRDAHARAHARLARWDERSDAVKLLTAVAAFAEASAPGKPPAAAEKLCREFFLREKAMREVQLLRRQLHHLVSAARDGVSEGFVHVLPLPSEKERKLVNQIVAAGFVDQVAIRADLLLSPEHGSAGGGGFGRKPRRAGEVAYRTLRSSAEDIDPSAPLPEQELQRSVFVHPSSVLARLSVTEMPAYVIYSHLSRSALSSNKVPRTRMHPLVVVGPKQLAALAEGTPLLEVGKPIGKIEEMGEKRRRCWVGVSIRARGEEGRGWGLGAWKVVQRREKGGTGEWVVEEVL
ncbi:hypothetical protein M433DRAFT_35250, partial [Acidomyces richmondensis BFW]